MTEHVVLTSLRRVRYMAESGEARAIRERARLSLTEVADAAGVAPSTLARWELGDRRPRGEAALRYLSLLDQLVGLDTADLPPVDAASALAGDLFERAPDTTGAHR